MKRLGQSIAAAILAFLLFPTTANAATLIPVGRIVGLQLRDNCISVAAFDEAFGEQVKESGLKIGDIIVKINGIPVSSTEDVRALLDGSDTPIRLTLRRSNRELTLSVTPQSTPEGKRLGVYLRQGIAGVGTVTWFDPATQTFGALGHGVNDSNGCLLQMQEGSVFPAEILSVNKGKAGHPGQLKGSASNDASFGILTKNTPQGVFGRLNQSWQGVPVETASADQLHTGRATILSTVCGDTPKEYHVEIVKLYAPDKKDGRNMLLRITDPSLLEITGGIVQGMSGSPILQDGRLVGAVTHVLVNNPEMGYGIFIGNMLDAAA